MDRRYVGVSSWTFAWAIGVTGFEKPAAPVGARGLLERAAALGAGVLQVADNLPLHALSGGELNSLADAARIESIALEAGTRGLAPDNLARYLDIAQRVGAKLVRTLPHDGADRPDFAEAARRLEAALPAYERAGVALGIENHDFYPARWLARLLDAFPSPCLGACVDPVNNLGQGESQWEVYAALCPRAVNFHCKDFAITRKPSMLGFDVTGAAFGDGQLDLAAARAASPSGISYVIELWTPWQNALDATLTLESAWAERSVARLFSQS